MNKQQKINKLIIKGYKVTFDLKSSKVVISKINYSKSFNSINQAYNTLLK
jgi:hypothetical protein